MILFITDVVVYIHVHFVCVVIVMESVLQNLQIYNDNRTRIGRENCLRAALGDCDSTTDKTADFTLKNLEANKQSSHHGFRELQFMFYIPPDDDDIRNRMVAWATAEVKYSSVGERYLQKIAHVELSFATFPDGTHFSTNKTAGFSINQGSFVFFREKSWRKGYIVVTILIPSDKYVRLFQKCAALSQEKIKFDAFGMYASHFAPRDLLTRRTRETHGTFCSRIITEILQEEEICMGFFGNLTPAVTTPCKLYMCIDSDRVQRNVGLFVQKKTYSMFDIAM